MAETVKLLYTATGTSEGGRNGTALSGDGLIDVNLSVPKAMGGPGNAGATTPEDLFAVGYAACFAGAVEFMGVKNNLKPSSVKVESAVGIGTTETGMGLKVELTVSVGGLSQADAERIVALGHAFCPYSKAIAGNVDVDILVKTA